MLPQKIIFLPKKLFPQKWSFQIWLVILLPEIIILLPYSTHMHKLYDKKISGSRIISQIRKLYFWRNDFLGGKIIFSGSVILSILFLTRNTKNMRHVKSLSSNRLFFIPYVWPVNELVPWARGIEHYHQTDVEKEHK